MGKSLIVKEHEKISSYDKSKLLSYRTVGPYRSTVCQFQAASGKYSILPIVQDAKNLSGFYKLRIYFNCPEDDIDFHSEFSRKKILSYDC